MHKKAFVAAVKVDGKVLRESSDRVELPFGSEYSVLLKNLDTVRMQARIDIDGQDATGWLVVEPGQSVDVERFYRQNRDRGNRFKFIERTQRIEEHRGVGAEDGLIRVEFKREKVYDSPKIVEHHTYHHHSWPYVYPRPSWPYWQYNYTATDNTIHNANAGQGSLISQSGNFSTSNQTAVTRSARPGPSGSSLGAMNFVSQSMGQRGPLLMKSASEDRTIGANEAGITVDGSISNQKFTTVAGFECEAPEVIVLHLVGRSNTQPIKVAKTVSQKLVCETCGKKNKSVAKFCIECGTSLEKV